VNKLVKIKSAQKAIATYRAEVQRTVGSRKEW